MANLKDTNIFGLLKAMGDDSTLYPVDLIVEIDGGYVRYNSGLQICYGVETC